MTNNQLAENSIIQLLNSVKLARDNAERADNRVDHSFYYALTIALEELQERRKAAMDSEPVLWAWHHLDMWHVTSHDGRARDLWLSGFKVIPLYRHAQPASVAPEEMTPQQASRSYGGEVRGYRAGWNACRAAMLQELKKSAGTEAICRNDENVQVLHANPPVIPDGSSSMLRRWLAFGRGMQNAGSQLPHNLIAETESMLAAAPQEVKGE